MKKWLTLISILLMVTLLVACQETEEPEEKVEERVVAVETAFVEEGNLVVDKQIYGRLMPSSITPVMIQMPGEIEKLEVENGDIIEEDEVIATLITPAGKQEIKAPATGEINNLSYKEEDIAVETEPFATIVDTKEFLIQTGVTHQVRSLLEKGETYEAIIHDRAYEVEVTSIASMPDETGLYPIEAVVENNNDELIAGMIASLTIPEQKVENALILPTEAIVEESDGTFIYVVNDNVAVKTEIEVLVFQSELTAIKGEINEGDEVVINGQLTLTDGSQVNVVEEGNES